VSFKLGNLKKNHSLDKTDRGLMLNLEHCSIWPFQLRFASDLNRHSLLRTKNI